MTQQSSNMGPNKVMKVMPAKKPVSKTVNDNMMPKAVDLEEIVLGAILLEQEALMRVIDILTPETFYKEAHSKIYLAIHTLFTKSLPIDISTVTNELRNTGDLDVAGGPFGITSLTNRVASAANIEFHARIIVEKFIQREIIRVTTETQGKAYEQGVDVFDIMDHAARSIFDIVDKNVRKQHEKMSTLVVKAIEQIEAASKNEDGVTGVPSGLEDLDRMTGGWQKTDFIVIGGRPGCIAGDTKHFIMKAKGGAGKWYTTELLFNTFNKPVKKKVKRLISCYKQGMRLTGFNEITDVIKSGVKKLYRVVTEEGNVIKTTLDHKFLTNINGFESNYKPLSELGPGNIVIVRPDQYKMVGYVQEEKIVSIEYWGEEMTYDICCKYPYNNFIGNRFVVHNSGKTAYALTLARNAAIDFNKPTAIFSLEMGAVQLVNRLIAGESEIDLEKLRSGKLSDDEFQMLNARISKLTKAPLYIDDTPALSIFELKVRAKRLKEQFKIEMIVIDYLQLMTGGIDSRPGNREQEIGIISRSLKALAKELDIPIIALSQLSRDVEKRSTASKRPQLSDLRESGAIEQDSDVVMFIFRPEYYGIVETEDGKPTKGLAEIIIAKHRNGNVGTVDLKFIGRFGKFANMNYVQKEAGYTNPTSGIEPNDDFLSTPPPANSNNISGINTHPSDETPF